jgi:hypothetical protein
MKGDGGRAARKKEGMNRRETEIQGRQ